MTPQPVKTAKPPITIGIDLGGTNLKGAVVDRAGCVLAKRVQPSEPARGAAAIVEDAAHLVGALLADASRDLSHLVAVGLGTPGPLSQKEGRIFKSANLPGWRDVPIVKMLAEKVGRPVTLDNDGNAAAFGEYWAGAGRGCEDLVMLTLGTGVGGGVMLGGRVLHGHFENAAELGHMIVVVNGLPCACGQRGCLEQYASASGLARRVADAIREGQPSTLAEAVRTSEPIDAEQVVACAQAGDALCMRLWDEACRYLAAACINLQHTFNPARVLLGGGMSQAGDFLLELVRDHMDQQRWSLHDDLPEIVLASLGYDAGVIGAAGLAWRQEG